jgi:hypothetical protein
MEELQTKTFDVKLDDKVIHCTLKERDFGDYIVYDVFDSEKYLFTLSKNGDVLFNEPEVSGKPHAIMDPRQLNEVIEQLRQKMGDIA